MTRWNYLQHASHIIEGSWWSDGLSLLGIDFESACECAPYRLLLRKFQTRFLEIFCSTKDSFLSRRQQHVKLKEQKSVVTSVLYQGYFLCPLFSITYTNHLSETIFDQLHLGYVDDYKAVSDDQLTRSNLSEQWISMLCKLPKNNWR